MFTRKVSFYFGLASVLLVLGLLLEDWQLASMVLLVASLFFLANFWGLPEKIEFDMGHRLDPADSFGDEDISVKFKVSNNTGFPLRNVEVEEILPEIIKPKKGARHVLTRLSPRETAELSLEFRSPIRGRYKIGPLYVRVRDPFGFYLNERQKDADVLSIMPKPERVRGAELRPRHLGLWPGVTHARIRGPGTEFYSMRGYVGGDDPKRINWKASAKHASLIVNETEAERVTDIMVVLDTDVTFYEQGETELFERGVRAAASIASLLLTQGNRVGMILQGAERGVVPPAFGKRHERNILSLLATAKPGRALLSTSYVMTVLAHLMLPAMAQIVLVSPLLDSSLVNGIRSLAMSGYSVLVISPTPTTPTRFESEQEEIAFRVLMLERSNTLLALEKVCTIAQWPLGISLSTVLKEVRRPRLAIRN